MNVWAEPITPIKRAPLGYMDGLDLVRWHGICERLVKTFDGKLDSVMHMGLIDALQITADNQGSHDPATFTPEPHDGFYKYHGSIDTSMLNEKLIMLIHACNAYNAARGDGHGTIDAGHGEQHGLVQRPARRTD